MTTRTLNPLVSNPRKKNISSIENLLILIFLSGIAILIILCTYKWIMSQRNTITPEEMAIQKASKFANVSHSLTAILPLAYAYQRNEDYENALKLYQEVLTREPNNVAATYNIGIIKKNQNNFKEAEQYLKKALIIRSDHVLAAYALGEMYITEKKYDQAISILNKAIQIKGDLVNPRLLKAKALILKGKKQDAIKEYKIVLQYIPNQPEALAGLKN